MNGLPNLYLPGRRRAVLRAHALFARDPLSSRAQEATQRKSAVSQITQGKMLSAVTRLLRYAAVPLPAGGFLTIACGCGVIFSALAVQLCSMYALPLFFSVGVAVPFALIDQRANKRADAFSEEYSSVLLAAASSMKSGMTAYSALERAVRLLPKDSIVRGEVQQLLTALGQGVPRGLALEQFGAAIRQPDLALFRTAFALVLQHGGRFAPTLERLAEVCKDRAVLVRSAKVNTATMRMTANVLLVLTPVILGMVAIRTENYWTIFREHPVANALGTVGLLVIGMSYGVLRSMSNFKA